MRCLRFHSCIQTTCSLSCILLTSCLFRPICHPSICRQVPTQCILSSILAACSAGIHTGSWLGFLSRCQVLRHEMNKVKGSMPVLSWPHRSCQNHCTGSANVLLTHLSTDFIVPTDGPGLLASCTHRKNQPRSGQM